MSLEWTEKGNHFDRRFVISLLVILAFFLIASVRLVYLQMIRGKDFEAFSERHTMKEIKIPASRGVLFDRHHVPIAENRPSFDLVMIPQEVADLEKLKKAVQKIAKVEPLVLEEKWKERGRYPSYYPIVLASDISYDTAIKVRTAKGLDFEPEEEMSLNGVEVMVRPLRSYPQGPVAATSLGYMAEVTEKDLNKFRKERPGKYALGDLVGATGLERFWDVFLKGRDGYQQRIVDAVGREVKNSDLETLLTEQEAQRGENLTLTLDVSLQKLAEERFLGKAGSLVAIDLQDGGVLAMVSTPTFDPTRLVSNVSPGEWGRIVSDPRHLLLNRAIQGAYPPGSTYKIVTAIAALEEKIIKPHDTISCPGGLQYGGRFFKCWNKNGHGAISLARALASSCDTYFYQLGLRLGVDRMAHYAHMLGFGKKTGIDLEGEKSGTIPTSEWKMKVFKQPWHPGENISISVGQGYDTATPLQNALMVGQVALGRFLTPHLLMGVEDEEGGSLPVTRYTIGEPLPISQATLKAVREGMFGAVETPEGTAYRSRSGHFRMAGKTGTAQVISEEKKVFARSINTEDHAWFVAYAPYDHPKIAVACIVEHGGFGASAAAPIVKDVIERYLNPENPKSVVVNHEK